MTVEVEGFDEWGTSDATLHGWSGLNSLQTGRFGGQCARFVGTTTYTRGLPVTATRQTMGFAWRTDNASIAIASVLDYREGATVHARLAYNGNGTFTVSRNGTTVGSNPTTPNLGIASNTWYYIELDYLCADGTGGAYELRVNGVTVAFGSGVDTRNGGTGVLDTMAINVPSGRSLDWDDVYWADGSDSFQGDGRVITNVPNSDGADDDWTPSTGSAHYAVVDEVPQNGDTDYVSSSTATDRDTYGMPALGVTGTVVAVQIQAMARKDDAGTRLLGLVVRSGGTVDVDAGQPLTSTYTPIKRVLLTDPDTGSAWTVGGVNAAEVGIEVVS